MVKAQLRRPAPPVACWVIASAFLFGVGGCKPKKPILKLRDLTLRSIGTKRVDLVLELDVFNPNLWDATLRRLDYKVSVFGVEFIQAGVESAPDKFKSMESRLLRVPASVNLRGIVEIARRARGAEVLECDMAGVAEFSVLGIPVPVELSQKSEIRRLRRPRWRFKRVRLPSGIRDPVKFVFEVTNPNSFALPTAGIRGRVLAGSDVLAEIEMPFKGRIAPGETRQVAFSLRLKPLGIAGALRTGWPGAKPVGFDGQFDLDPPISLRERAAARVKPK